MTNEQAHRLKEEFEALVNSFVTVQNGANGTLTKSLYFEDAVYTVSLSREMEVTEDQIIGVKQ